VWWLTRIGACRHASKGPTVVGAAVEAALGAADVAFVVKTFVRLLLLLLLLSLLLLLLTPALVGAASCA